MDIRTTEKAIVQVKQSFEKHLREALNLERVSSPLYVAGDSGIQDNLNGIEKPISFAITDIADKQYEIVHSLAKWKRLALRRYGFQPGEGLYTDMNALRPDEGTLRSGIHSVYVDQWDWEKVMDSSDRKLEYLKQTVRLIYGAMVAAEKEVCDIFASEGLKPVMVPEITFIQSEDLLKQYPDKTPKEREVAACKKYGSVFVIGIGGALSDGAIHDGRAPDYDDWSTPSEDGYKGLNGDILVWNEVLGREFELSSMGIRVDPVALERQLVIRDAEDRKAYPWHKELLAGKLPQTIGGGIGQSRFSMFVLKKQHIGEVQVSAWPKEILAECEARGIDLL